MAAHLIGVQDKIVNTLCKVKQQSPIEYYMTNPKTCIEDSSEEFNFWLLSIEQVSKLTGIVPGKFVLPKLKKSSKVFIFTSITQTFMAFPHRKGVSRIF